MIENIVGAIIAHMDVGLIAVSAFGVAMGIVFGAIPGLNQGVLMVLTLPLTFYMNSLVAQVLLIGMYVGGVAGSMVTGVMIGIPGSPASVMTTYDGHAMAKRGEGARALALGVTASFVGGMISWLVLATASVPLARFAITFSGFEMAALVFGGLLMIASASGGNMIKGLIAGALGVLVSLVGLDPITTDPRFTFGFEKLESGLGIFPVLLGIFAIGGLVSDIQQPKQTDAVSSPRLAEILRAVGSTFRYGQNLVRSSLIGTWIGILPGIGANIGAVISYTVARSLSQKPEKFGSGAEEGVVAAEAGNNATVGGALVPMITLGIPGSAADVILMAALIFHNIQPGPLMMVEHEATFFGIIATYFVATVLMFFILVASCGFIGRITEVPRHILAPVIFVVAIIGTYSINGQLFDIWVMLTFGVVGVLMKWSNIPSAPFVIGFILAPLFEANMRSALMTSDGSFAPFVSRPISLAILVFAVIFVLWPTLTGLMRRRNASEQ